MNRRAFLSSAAALAVPSIEAAVPHPVIDTHAHFYDPSRPQGVPWPPKDDKVLYRTVLPDEYIRITKPLGITGVIEVEASPWLEDNQWVLNLADKYPIIVATVGHLNPGQPDFRKNLARFHKDRRFRGIRLGESQTGDAALTPDLKELAAAGLELDVLGGPPMLAQVVRLTDRVPDLRIVIDHLPFDPPAQAAERAAYEAALRELGKRPRVYAKVSNVVRKQRNHVPEDVNFYRPSLDQLWDIFGPDRLVYGSNWPVSNLIASYPIVFKIVRDYFAGKGREATEKYFWKNSKAAYHW